MLDLLSKVTETGLIDLLVAGDRHRDGYVIPIVYCGKIMQMFIELINQSL